eukprot:Sdes_comp18348_c0_seq2m8105
MYLCFLLIFFIHHSQGYLAGAGLYAIQEHFPSLDLVHERTKMFADRLANLGFILESPPETNMLLVQLPENLMKKCPNGNISPLYFEDLVEPIAYSENILLPETPDLFYIIK